MTITFSFYLLHFLFQSKLASFRGSQRLYCSTAFWLFLVLVHKANRHLKRHQISGSLDVLVAALDQGELLPKVYLCRGLCCRASLTHFFIRWCDTAVPPSVGWPPIRTESVYGEFLRKLQNWNTHHSQSSTRPPSLACLFIKYLS